MITFEKDDIKDKGNGIIVARLSERFGRYTRRVECRVMRIEMDGSVGWKIERQIDEGFHDHFRMGVPIDMAPITVWSDCCKWFSNMLEYNYKAYLDKKENDNAAWNYHI